MWRTILEHLPKEKWVGIEDIYRSVEAHVQLQPDDDDVVPGAPTDKRWRRNVRNILQARKNKGLLMWRGDGEYMLLDAARSESVTAERARRLSLWEKLRAIHDMRSITPEEIRRHDLYAGMAGIYRGRKSSRELTGGESDVTTSLLHTGRVYADDLTTSGILYHYPKTSRPGKTDENEIEATKWAAKLNLPVFVITPSKVHRSTREVQLGWIESWDDENGTFQVSFRETPPNLVGPRPVLEPLELFPSPTRVRPEIKVSRDALLKARESAEAIGLEGEKMYHHYLLVEQANGRVKEFEWTSKENAVSPYDFVLVEQERRVVDVKTTSGPFEREFHLSGSELAYASHCDCPYDLARIFDIGGVPELRVARDIRGFAAEVLAALTKLPPGMKVDSVSIPPALLPFGKALLLPIPEKKALVP